MLPDSNEIARAVSILSLLRNLGWRVRNRNRADCGVCRGTSKGTIAFTERLWKCHRCNEGGDVFSLVRVVNSCEFPDALRYVAELAGIRVRNHLSIDFRREMAARRRQRARVDDCEEKLAALERALLRELRGRIHDAERQRLRVSQRLAALARGEGECFRGEHESLWLTLQVAVSLLNADISAYSLLSFGAPAERARFLLHPELRDEIISSVQWAGYVRTADGKQIEVPV